MTIFGWLQIAERARQRHRGPLGDGFGGVILAGAIIPRHEVHETTARVLRIATALRATRHGQHGVDIGFLALQEIAFHRQLHLLRAFHGGAGGKLEAQRGHALIFRGLSLIHI